MRHSDDAATGEPMAMPRATTTRLNNIAELRLLFAASVVLSHAAALLGDDRHRLLRTLLNSEAAVQGFFVLSGYLVCASYARLQSPRAFFERRFWRIYPAYVVAVVVFIALALAQAGLMGTPVTWSELPRYLMANLATLNFVQPTVGGLFPTSAVQAVNGALWSIKVEIMFYLILPLLFRAGQRTSFLAASLALVVCGTLWWPALQLAGDWLGIDWPLSMKFQLPGQIHFFGLGIALFARLDGRLSAAGTLTVGATALSLLLVFGMPGEALHALVLVALIGTVSRLPQMPDPFRGQDISYGIYLSHFPLIQILLAGGAADWPFAVYLGIVCLGAVGYGLASWNLIERRALAVRRPAASGRVTAT